MHFFGGIIWQFLLMLYIQYGIPYTLRLFCGFIGNLCKIDLGLMDLFMLYYIYILYGAESFLGN